MSDEFVRASLCRRRVHLGPDDEPEFSALCARFDEYVAYFTALDLTLVLRPENLAQ